MKRRCELDESAKTSQHDDLVTRREKALDELRDSAIHAAKEDREAAATELWRAYLRERPRDGFGWFQFGMVLRVLGLKADAERALNRALEESPTKRHVTILLQIGRLYEEAGRRVQAEECYRRVCEDAEYGQFGYSWIIRGGNMAAMERLPEAEECHRKALAFFDENVNRDEAFLNLGYVLRAQGRYTEAREAFERALEITPAYQEAVEGLQSLAGVDEAMAKTREIAKGREE